MRLKLSIERVLLFIIVKWPLRLCSLKGPNLKEHIRYVNTGPFNQTTFFTEISIKKRGGNAFRGKVNAFVDPSTG